MMRSLLLLLTLIHWAQAAWWITEDTRCDPLQKGWLPYTGWRFFRSFDYSFGLRALAAGGFPVSSRHFIRMTHCTMGKVDYEAGVPCQRKDDFVWNTDYCTSPTTCYRPVRRKKYATREMAIYLPFATVVGGLFMCPNFRTTGVNCTNENAVPVKPLIADFSGYKWTEYPSYTSIEQQVPYLYTPDMLDIRFGRPFTNNEWSEFLDVNENYDWSEDDRSAINKAVTDSVNLLHGCLDASDELIVQASSWKTWSSMFGELEGASRKFLSKTLRSMADKISIHEKRVR